MQMRMMGFFIYKNNVIGGNMILEEINLFYERN